jgi:hypothetical protein
MKFIIFTNVACKSELWSRGDGGERSFVPCLLDASRVFRLAFLSHSPTISPKFLWKSSKYLEKPTWTRLQRLGHESHATITSNNGCNLNIDCSHRVYVQTRRFQTTIAVSTWRMMTTTSWMVIWMEDEVLNCTTHLPNSPWNIHEIRE